MNVCYNEPFDPSIKKLDHLRAQPGSDIFEAVWAEGCAMNLEQIIHALFASKR